MEFAHERDMILIVYERNQIAFNNIMHINNYNWM